MLDKNTLSEVVSEETQRHQEQLDMEQADKAACIALLKAIPLEVRKALARRTGETVFESNTIKCFFVWPTKPYNSPYSWCWWRWSDHDEYTITAVKSAIGFDLKGRLVKVSPIVSADEYTGYPELWFVDTEISEEDAVDFMPHQNGSAETLAIRLNDGLQRTLAELRKRREKLSHLKRIAQVIADAIDVIQ